MIPSIPAMCVLLTVLAEPVDQFKLTGDPEIAALRAATGSEPQVHGKTGPSNPRAGHFKAQEKPDMPGVEDTPVPDRGTPTLGGRQFWGDLHFECGFKIQRNVVFGQYRLLDREDRRYESGSLEACHAMLHRLRASRNAQPESGHVVIFLHGLGRSSKSLNPIMRALPEDRFTCIGFEYPSTRVPLAQSAGYLNSVIKSLTHAEQISFVVHSMGGLVVRRYLQDHRDPRLFRMVMLGTPNNGAELADMLHRNLLFRAVYGPAGQELVTRSDGVIRSLPIPDFPFGLIAGGNGADGYNRLLPGDDDGTVTVESVRLEGAAGFLRVPSLHTFLTSNPVVAQAVRSFLESGEFPNP